MRQAILAALLLVALLGRPAADTPPPARPNILIAIADDLSHVHTSFTGYPAGPSFDARQLQPPTSGMNRNDYASNFADFLPARPKDRPLYFWYGALEPHRSYARGSGLQAMGSIHT